MELYIPCECHSVDHVVRFTKDEEWGVYVNVQLDPYLPFWRKVWVALKYVFGHYEQCHWAECVLTDDTRDKVVEFLRR